MPQKFHQNNKEPPWTYHINPIAILQKYHRHIMKIPQESNRNPLDVAQKPKRNMKIQQKPKTIPQEYHRNAIEVPQKPYENPMEFLQEPLGKSMAFFMVFPQDSYGNSIGFSWSFYGIPIAILMVVLWDFFGFWDFVGFSFGLSCFSCNFCISLPFLEDQYWIPVGFP